MTEMGRKADTDAMSEQANSQISIEWDETQALCWEAWLTKSSLQFFSDF